MSVNYSKYYTPIVVAEQLVSLLCFTDYAKAIDICCGSGNLLSAANAANRTLECTGVDIRPSDKCMFKTIKSDGRHYATEHAEEFDFALANPPFGKAEESEYATALSEKSTIGITNSRIEIQMLNANLLLLKKGGTLLIILPSTIVDGVSSINIRKQLAAKYYIKAIVDMPINSFYPSRIKCSALIIEKTKNITSYPTTLYSMSKDFKISREYDLPNKLVVDGQWLRNNHSNNRDFTIVQGKIHSNQFSESGTEVLHTAKMAEKWQPSTRYTNLEDIDEKLLKVNSGDLIISRIGVSAGAVYEYTGEAKLVSDCLLIVKKPSDVVKRRILAMDLKRIVKGLSTPHITASSIYDLYGAMYEAN